MRVRARISLTIAGFVLALFGNPVVLAVVWRHAPTDGTPHVMVMARWLGFWALGLKQLTSRFDSRAWRRRVEALGGLVLVGLGIRTGAQPG